MRGPDRPQRTHENGLAHVPAGTSRFDERRTYKHRQLTVRLGRGGAECGIEWCARLPHGVEDDCHPTSQCGSGTFETEPLPQHEARTAERTFLTDPRQEHSGSFVKQSAQLAITTPRDVAVIVNFSRLKAPRCETEPGTNRARPLEGIGLLERGDIGDSGERTDARHGHESATGHIRLYRSDEATV